MFSTYRTICNHKMLPLFNALCVVVQMLDPSIVGEQVILDCYRLFSLGHDHFVHLHSPSLEQIAMPWAGIAQ